MRIARRLLLGLPLAALLVLAVACDTGEPDTDSAASGEAVALALAQLGSYGQGIQATGNGTVAIVPDVALLTLGVETMGDSVAEARGEAAASMAAIMDVLRARGIEELDIRTSFLNISPEYSYQEILREGARINGRVLVGYRVNNSMVVKVRDLDAVGDVVDEVAEAGGQCNARGQLEVQRRGYVGGAAPGKGNGRQRRDRKGGPACLLRRRNQGHAD